ncbi:MAG: UDP-N-acetylenolpyruvoylglucosamine reductase, partial [Candidatus Marinimicrobia bacterium]|nr:UDP-N-acetylenolpyruvoylglucosamine reductase [Candidatus Neomarinimicrobiota bacterium]
MAELNKIVKGQLVENEPMALHSSYGVGGPAKAYITPKNVNDLSRILQYAHSHG